MDKMKAEYDFSKGIRGKFYVPATDIQLPHYLTPKLEQNLNKLAERTGRSPDALLQLLLEKELNNVDKLAL